MTLAALIDLPTWPGFNVAFVLSMVATVVLTLLVIPFGKRRPVGTPLTWGGAMAAATYAYGVMFLAYGIAPHQWLTHADNELSWRKDKLVFGPFDILKPQSLGGPFPFTINYSHIKDIIATAIYVVFLGLHIWIWAWWQKRGKAKSVEVAVSTYGRPLVRKG